MKKSKKSLIGWLIVGVIVMYGVIRIFSHIYESTKRLRAEALINRYADINMNIVESVSKVLETMSVDSPKELSKSHILKREKRVEELSKQFPKTHAFYQAQCLSCHGPVGQGGKALSFLGTHLNHAEENIAYHVPLLKNTSWSFHKDSPHLPSTGIDRLSKEEFLELERYLRTLVE
ncbi:MAG: hypothetical protein A2Z91_00580 [Deltaproteobacteria bacterium GWA2_38_16]|nr:MAG: hypothetical protein A2Z91_00580 [Deltaproteobacteria bacterium GWA2_38_16]OGQ35010.1 MAG: hypothetical protein A3A72_07840 [Deltaproteobacteria bacterium RIFCSPLOWO2_01_FULL_38_9]OGQ61913.1 MAG: hypothetical protein A3G92_02270 [Deltaproteobacteria bacterium RIFCSPLOWO2_12_FULL_38_8]HBQ21160.1 hypothetical protein [Deltaproteobacteria bacterium]